jgi:hypothetical protein
MMQRGGIDLESVTSRVGPPHCKSPPAACATGVTRIVSKKSGNGHAGFPSHDV